MTAESVDVTNLIRKQRGKDPINPYVIEGFEGPGPPLQTLPGSEPIVDLDDDEPVPPEARRLTARELIGATTTPSPSLPQEPALLILDREARYSDMSVTLSEAAVNQIMAIVLREKQKQMKDEIKAIRAKLPKRTYVKRAKKGKK
jgi:hypothetical protein